MKHDSHYRAIQTRLQGELDPEIFERCAVDLLRKDYPTLVPVRGGSDDGSDGELPGGLPLITTTGKSATGNLNKNLSAYLEAGRPSRKALFATSRILTQQQRKNLSAAANKLGFELHQIHDGADFADRLYASSKWCRELLALEGLPQALVEVPISNRPQSDLPLVGRDAEFEELRQWRGDGLLIGQPGSGKSALLRQLQREQRAYFLVSDETTAIANAIRDLGPEVVIVDDAHAKAGLVGKLRQLRQSVGGTFRILAASWPDPFDRQVRTEFGPSSLPHIELPRLSRNVILELIRSTGISFSDGWLHELLDQSAGLPGLAITLCDTCRDGRAKDVLDGTAILQEIDVICQKVAGQQNGELRRILAIFALAGRGGLDVRKVAQLESISTAELTARLSEVAPAGVIAVQRNRNSLHIAVQPAPVRHALVKDAFFGAVPLLWHHYAELSDSPDEVMLTLLGAVKRGAEIDREELFARVMQSRSTDVWGLYASLGEPEARRAVAARPDRLEDLCDCCLALCPEQVLPEVIRRAIRGEQVFLQSLQEWIGSVEPGDSEAIERRRLLIETLVSLPESGEQPAQSLSLIDQLFWPAFEENVVAPGNGDHFQSRFGMLRLPQIEQVVGLWPAIFAWIQRQPQTPWKEALRLVQHWAFPNFRHSADASQLVVAALHSAAARYLSDIASIASQKKENPAVVESLYRLADRLKVDLHLERDPDFQILFASLSNGTDWQVYEEACLAQVAKLAERWSRETPDAVVSRILRYKRCRDEVEWHSADRSWYLCTALCRQGIDCLAWAEAFHETGAGDELVAQFGWNAVTQRCVGIEAFLSECLHSGRHRSWLIGLALKEPQLNGNTADEILDSLAEGDAAVVKTLYLEGPEIPPRLAVLLKHHIPSIRLAAAVAIAQACDNQIPEDFLSDWKAAIVDLPKSENARWRTDAILQRYPDLAYPLLKRNLHQHWDLERAPELPTAASLLTESERLDLIQQLPPAATTDLTETLVGRSNDCFRALQRTTLPLDVRCSLLRDFGMDGWADLAAVALAEDVELDDLAHVCCWPTCFIGDESVEWGRRLTDSQMISTDNHEVQALLDQIIAVCTHHRDSALKHERERQVLGRDYRRF